jgi:primase-polymerase (primpol)-like protein
MTAEVIPTELRERRQWVAWRRQSPPGAARVMKFPVNPRTGRRADNKGVLP